MINSVVLVGRLTRDPELRYTANGAGAAVVKFTLAVERNFTNQIGERETDFIFISVWRNLAENVAKYCVKGSLVALTGRLQVRSFENEEGRTMWMTEVVADQVKFLDYRNKEQQDNSNDPLAEVGKPIDLDDLDLPFDI